MFNQKLHFFHKDLQLNSKSQLMERDVPELQGLLGDAKGIPSLFPGSVGNSLGTALIGLKNSSPMIVKLL